MKLESRENIPMHPDCLTKNEIGLEVHVNMDNLDPKEQKEGVLVDFDDSGIYVKIGAKKAKKFPYKGSAFKYIQNERGIIFDKLSPEEQEKKDERERRNEEIREARMERMLRIQQEEQDGKKKPKKKPTPKKSSPKKEEENTKPSTEEEPAKKPRKKRSDAGRPRKKREETKTTQPAKKRPSKTDMFAGIKFG